jgi:hypothetical protein
VNYGLAGCGRRGRKEAPDRRQKSKSQGRLELLCGARRVTVSPWDSLHVLPP